MGFDVEFGVKVVEKGGHKFRVFVEKDEDFGPPWGVHDGHGKVSEWTTRQKKSGELVLAVDRNLRRYYDFAGAVETARKDGWGCEGVLDTDTPGQRAVKAARSDYEYLRAWCHDEWFFTCVTVSLMDQSGDVTEISEHMGGIEGDNAYVESYVQEMIDEILAGEGKDWEAVEINYISYERKSK